MECSNFTGSFELRPSAGGSGAGGGGPDPRDVPGWLGRARAGTAATASSQPPSAGVSQHVGGSREKGCVTDFVGVESPSLSPSVFASQTQPEVPATQPDPPEAHPSTVLGGGGGRKRQRAEAPVAAADLEASTQVEEEVEGEEAEHSAVVPELPCTGSSQGVEPGGAGSLRDAARADSGCDGYPASLGRARADSGAAAALSARTSATDGVAAGAVGPDRGERSSDGRAGAGDEGAQLTLSELVRATWSARRVTGDTAAPSARWGHGSTLLGDGRALVYGGQNAADKTLGDVHVFDAGRGEWVAAANASSLPRRWHTVTYVPHRHIAIAFGGESPTPEGHDELVDALMVLDADLMLWYAPTVSGRGPAPRYGAAPTSPSPSGAPDSAPPLAAAPGTRRW